MRCHPDPFPGRDIVDGYSRRSAPGRGGPMALSEYEQRKLDEIERALRRADPGFAGTLNLAALRRHRRLVAAVTFAVGLLVLVAAAGPLLPGRPRSQREEGTKHVHPGRPRRSGMEDRFRRRFEHPDE